MTKILPVFAASIVAAGCVANAAPAAAQASAFADTAQIDRLVESFTGRGVGTAGGARERVDSRLRLRACAQALDLGWYGAPGRTVEVQCAGQGGWRIYVNLMRDAAPQAAAKVIERGETITIAVRGRGFSIQQKGEAEEAGAIGDWISVRADRKASAVRAQVVRPGLVVISAD